MLNITPSIHRKSLEIREITNVEYNLEYSQEASGRLELVVTGL